jgi:hypothetical protein
MVPEDGDSMFLQNGGICLQVHMALQPRRPALTIFNCFPKSALANSRIIPQNMTQHLPSLFPVVFRVLFAQAG